jgi:catechol 2,3-dioxygenase-like lactoylglutathione lyase family enzyme
MIDHVSIGVRNVAASKRFYDAVLQPLGYRCISDSPESLGYGAEAPALWITATDRPVPPDARSGLHFCFAASSRKSVDAFHTGGLACGRRKRGPARSKAHAASAHWMRSSRADPGGSIQPGARCRGFNGSTSIVMMGSKAAFSSDGP